MGKNTVAAGSYSSGEITSSLCCQECRLNNQTMSITRLRED